MTTPTITFPASVSVFDRQRVVDRMLDAGLWRLDRKSNGDTVYTLYMSDMARVKSAMPATLPAGVRVEGFGEDATPGTLPAPRRT